MRLMWWVARSEVEVFLRTHQLSDVRIGQIDSTIPATVDRFEFRSWALMRSPWHHSLQIP